MRAAGRLEGGSGEAGTPAPNSCLSLPPAPASHRNRLACSSCPALVESLPPTHRPTGPLQPQPPGWNFQRQSFSHSPDQISQRLTPQGTNYPKPQLSGPQGRLSPLEKVLAEAEHAALGKICPLKAVLWWLESILTQPWLG